MRFLVITLLLLFVGIEVSAQSVPAEDENIPFLVTFGRQTSKDWGDDDFCQIFFFVVPEAHKAPVFIRVFDPEVGGKNDESKGGFNTKVQFTVYGGKGAFSDNEMENKDPIGGYKNGNLLATKTFGVSSTYDNKWYAFGPFNPTEADYKPALGGYVLKIIAEGISGNDGNLYRYYLSTQKGENKAVEGGNAFTYEYTFRLHGEAEAVSHIYPYVDKNTVSVKQFNFDFDNDAYIKIVSVAKPGIKVRTSGESKWANSQHLIVESEKSTSLDIQMIKTGGKKNNNVAFYITNQYDKFLPFYAIPIGGIPKYRHKVNVRKR